MSARYRTAAIAFLALAALAACSPARMAANLAASAMSGGSDVYASDDDPELVKAALPFGLKTMEGLIESAPSNINLRLAAARGFTAYAWLVQETEAPAAAAGGAKQRSFDTRVAALFKRGRDQAMAGLEVRHAGFRKALRADPKAALATTESADVGLLYWAGAAWLGAISADKRDLEAIADLPQAVALITRVEALDPAYEGGAAEGLLMLYEAGRPAGMAAAKAHYQRALELSHGNSAGLYVGYAQAIAIPAQDRKAFRAALTSALAVDIDAVPAQRLTNVVAQRQARRLLAEEDRLFLNGDGGSS